MCSKSRLWKGTNAVHEKYHNMSLDDKQKRHPEVEQINRYGWSRSRTQSRPQEPEHVLAHAQWLAKDAPGRDSQCLPPTRPQVRIALLILQDIMIARTINLYKLLVAGGRCRE